MNRLAIILCCALVPGTASARDVLLVDGSPSMERRDPLGLAHAAAELLLLQADTGEAVAIHAVTGELVYSSPRRKSESEMTAARSALDRAWSVPGSSDLAQAVRLLVASESASPATVGGAVYLIGDGVPSLAFETLQQYGLSADDLARDPADFEQRVALAHDQRLAKELAALAGRPRAVWWIAPQGRRPGPEVTRLIQDSGGEVLAGGGVADLEALVGRHAAEAGSSWTLPLDNDPKDIQVPPGATELLLLITKPGHARDAITLTDPAGEKHFIGLGEVAVRKRLPSPESGRWRLEPGVPGLAWVSLTAPMELAEADSFSQPGVTGELRAGSVGLLGSEGQRIDASALDMARAEISLGGGEFRSVELRGDRWSIPLQLLDEPGTLPFQVRASLAHGRWRQDVELQGHVEVVKLALVHDLPAVPILAGQPCAVEVSIERNGTRWPEARGRVELRGLGAEPIALEPARGVWRTSVTPPAGETRWELRAELELAPTTAGGTAAAGAAGRVELCERGLFVVGTLELDLRGQLGADGWTGELTATSGLPAALELQVLWQPETGGAPPGAPRLLELKAAGETRVQERWDLIFPSPSSVGSHPGHVIATPLGLLGASPVLVEVNFLVPSWWERFGARLLWGGGLLGLIAVAVYALLSQRPYFQGELLCFDSQGRQLGGPVVLSSLQSPLGRRHVRIGSAANAEHCLPTELGLDAHHLTFRARRGDLGLVWAVVENTGQRRVAVGGEDLGPSSRLALGHMQEIQAGDVTVRYQQPLIADLEYTGRV